MDKSLEERMKSHAIRTPSKIYVNLGVALCIAKEAGVAIDRLRQNPHDSNKSKLEFNIKFCNNLLTRIKSEYPMDDKTVLEIIEHHRDNLRSKL